MKIKKTWDIGEVVQSFGLPPSTLRFYEEKGLIRSTGRNGLRRYYDSRTIEQLELIALGREAGFSLEEIKLLFAADGHPHIDRKLLLKKAELLDRHIKQLTAIRKTMEHVASCPVPNQMDCPKFQRLLKVAGRYQTKHRKPMKKKSSRANV